MAHWLGQAHVPSIYDGSDQRDDQPAVAPRGHGDFHHLGLHGGATVVDVTAGVCGGGAEHCNRHGRQAVRELPSAIVHRHILLRGRGRQRCASPDARVDEGARVQARQGDRVLAAPSLGLEEKRDASLREDLHLQPPSVDGLQLGLVRLRVTNEMARQHAADVWCARVSDRTAWQRLSS